MILLRTASLIIALSCLRVSSANAASPAIFNAPRDYAAASPSALVLADFNGDSKLDIALTNALNQSVTIYLSTGGVRVFTVVGYPSALAVGDFNGDSRPDLAVVSHLLGSGSILLGNGDGTFQAAQNLATNEEPVSVAVADFNGDSKLDIAVAHSFDVGTVVIFLGNGNGTFARGGTSVFTNTISNIVLGDFNNDSQVDIAVGIQYAIAMLKGNGNGTFQAAVYTTTDRGPGAS